MFSIFYYLVSVKSFVEKIEKVEFYNKFDFFNLVKNGCFLLTVYIQYHIYYI